MVSIMNRLAIFLICLFLLCIAGFAFAQEQKAPALPPISPSARLAAAKTAFMKNGGGSDVPFDVIQGGVEGWGRFTLVDSPKNADVVIELQAPEDDNGVSVSSSTGAGGKSSSKTSRDVSVSMIKLLVYDAHTHAMLWTATEHPKGAFKDKARMDNLVEASEKLLSQFRDRLEPLPAK